MYIAPKDYGRVFLRHLIEAAGAGHIGIDQRLIRALVETPNIGGQLPEFAIEDLAGMPVDLLPLVFDLYRHIGGVPATCFYVTLMAMGSHNDFQDFFEAVAELGEGGVEPLLEFAGSAEGKDLGAEIAFMLAALQVKDPRVEAFLLKRLDLDPWDTAISIGLYRDPALAPVLERKLKSQQPGDPHSKETVQALESALEQLTSTVSVEPHEPFDIFSRYPAEAAPVFEAIEPDVLLAFLESETPEYRAEAARTLGTEDPEEHFGDALLHLAQGDPELSVRCAALEALSGYAEVKKVHDELYGKLTNPALDPLEQSACAIGLAEVYQGDPDLAAHFRRFYDNPVTRCNALRAMSRSLDPAFGVLFPKHLDDPDQNIQLEAIAGVGLLQVGGAATHLKQFFDDEDLRTPALFSYALALPGIQSRKGIKALFAQIEADAYGLTSDEVELVEGALDQRMLFTGQQPVFSRHDHPAPVAVAPKPGRNEPCPCGSGKKYKKCCGQ
jgi:HEAT repeat protein